MKRNLILICTWLIIGIFGIAFAQTTPKPVWAKTGMLINDAVGNTPQQNPQLIADGKNNFIVVWEDGRSGYYDIYVQKINPSGQPLWNKDGAPACSSKSNQNFPQLASDMAGGAIIVWQDYRRGNADIFAQRIDASGKTLWGKDGIAVSRAPAGQFAPQIIPDGNGGAIITWHDYREGMGEDIFAQRINSNGKVLWQENGVVISTAAGTQWYPKIASDNAGGAVITWTDGRISPSDNNIFAQHVDKTGKTLWQADGLPVCSAASNQAHPQIISLSDGVIITWHDSRSKGNDIYAQKIDFNGKLMWPKDGAEICTIAYPQENPNLAPDGAGGAIIVWTDHRGEENNIFAQRILSNGKLSWQKDGRPINKSNREQHNPQIIKLIGEDWFVVWEEKKNQDWDIFGQRINSSGTALLPNSLQLASSKGDQVSATMATSLDNNIIVVWQDNRFGNNDIYTQKFSTQGKSLWNKAGIVICSTPGSVVQQNMEIILTEREEIILVFEDARSGFFNIYAQKIDTKGKLAWGLHGLAIAKVSENQTNPLLVTDNKGGAIIAWEDHRIPDKPKIRIQRLNYLGEKVWESSVPVAKIESKQLNPTMVSDGAGGAIISWQDDRDVLSLQDIYIQRLSAKGKRLWGENGSIAISANGHQIDADMITNGSGGAFLAWTDFRRGDRNPDIYAQQINNQGKPVWEQSGALVCGAPDVQRKPKLVSDGEGGIVVAWTDKGGGSYDIYGQQLDKNGKALWMTDGIPINQFSRTQQNPKFGHKNILVWEDYRYGNWDIFAAALSSGGKLAWGDHGAAVVSTPHTQYAPQISPWKNGSVLLCWEDYRSNLHYEIYLQELDTNGTALWGQNGYKNISLDGGRSPKLLPKPQNNVFYLFWEDYTGGGKAIYGQKYLVNS